MDTDTESEDEPAEPLKAIRIRIFPTQEQKQTLSTWFGTCRWTYNKCAEAINKRTVAANRKALRASFVNNVNFDHNNQWVVQTPNNTRDGAMVDALNALKLYKAKKKENQNGFKLKFRTKRDPTQCILVRKSQWNRPHSLFTSIFSAQAMKSSKNNPLPVELPHDSRLVRDKNHKYFLCVPISLDIKDTSVQTTLKKVVAIDPGVRTFVTTYDQDGEVNEIGKGDRERLFRLAIHVDKLTSKRAKTRNKQSRWRMKKAIGRLYDRIRNLTDDVHKKTASWLCDHHETILIPKFESSAMTKREGRRLHTKAVRSMLHWSHYRFRQFLTFKATEHPGVRVVIVGEEYTSKTCGKCGFIHTSLGANKLFRCPSCRWECDRDVNGARNILLKFLTEQQSSPSGECLGPGPFDDLVPTMAREMQNQSNKRARFDR